MKQSKIIAIDPGTGYIKLYSGGDPKQKSVIRVVNAFGPALDRVASFGKETPIAFDSIEGRGKAFVADQLALETGHATTQQDRQCIESLNVERGIFAALAKAGIQDGDVILPAFCIPVSEYKPGKGEEQSIHTQYLKDKWRGEHTFTVVGKEQITFTCEEPLVTAQGLAACFHYAFDTSGKMIHDIFNQDYFFLDTGKRDGNYGFLRGGNANKSELGTFDGLSWASVVRDVNEWLAIEHDAMFTDLEVERACRQKICLADEQSHYAIYWRDWIVLDGILSETVAGYARRQTQQISSLPIARAHKLLLCGGPAGHYLPYYQEYLDTRFAMVSPYYDVASVLGLYQMARMLKGEA